MSTSVMNKRRLANEKFTAATVFVERYGLDGNAPRSLAEVAERYGITRLEVRHLESRVLKTLKRAIKPKGES